MANMDPFNAFNSHRSTVNYLTHFSKKWKFLYVETPKVACSAIKRTLQLLELDGNETVLPQNVHDRRQSPLLLPKHDVDGFRHALTASDYTRFAFVRNPFARVLSCYLDKFVQNDWERKWRLPKLGFEPDARISLLDFLEAIRYQSCDEMDVHWMPQSFILSRSGVNYTFIGRLENFDPDFEKIVSAIRFDDASIVSRYAPHATGAGNQVAQYIGPAERDIITDLYERDFAEFVYSTSMHNV